MTQHQTTSQRRRPGLSSALVLLVALMLGFPHSASAAVRVGNIPNLDLGDWTPGMGPVSVVEDFCVQSDIFGFFALRWQARLDDLSGASTGSEFRIRSTSGSDSIAFTARLVDLRDGSSNTLTPGALTPIDYTGDFVNCPNGLNARLEFNFDASGLEGAGTGTFEGDFSLFAQRFGSDADSFRLRIRIPGLVQISDFDDIFLGDFGGAGDMTGSDTLCVYRNDPAARYEVEARGQGAGDAFVLAQGGDEIPFEVDFDDGTGFASMTAGGAALAAEGADTASTTCGGINNATVRVTVREADLAAASGGAYTGALTLTVAPI